MTVSSSDFPKENCIENRVIRITSAPLSDRRIVSRTLSVRVICEANCIENRVPCDSLICRFVDSVFRKLPVVFPSERRNLIPLATNLYAQIATPMTFIIARKKIMI